MTVGFVRQREVLQKEGGVIKWFEMSIRVPFGSCTLTMSERKKTPEDSPNAPDFDLWFSPNRKGESYDRMKAGSLWMKVSEKGNKYLSGYIETPIVSGGKMYISVVKYTPIEGMPVQPILYNVLWSAPQEKKEDDYGDYSQPPVSTQYAQPAQQYAQPAQAQVHSSNPVPEHGAVMPETNAIPEIDIEEDEIPF